MKILVTGAKGFVGKNLCAQLNNIRYAGDRCCGDITVDEVYEYDRDSSENDLERYCRDCDFVFNLAGVNRPGNPQEFMTGNFGFASHLLDTLKKCGNRCPVMISSSIQAGLAGRFANSVYGRSKKAGEELMFEYERETGAPVLVYRFPNIFGKWCRPDYNSAVATFCHNIANDLPIEIYDPSVEMELLYIDDLVDEMVAALGGNGHRCAYDDRYFHCPMTYRITLGEIVDLIRTLASQPRTLVIPEIPDGSFAKKLYSTYLSYLPQEKVSFPLRMNVDDRGSFTELLHTPDCGQISVSISRPGMVKGQHWHNTKWELFIVVSGHGLIRQRRVGSDEILDFEVSGDKIEAVHILPGYTHNIINLSDTENLVTVMYCNENFDPDRPDTYFLPVE